MSDRDIYIIIFNACFILLFIILLGGNIHNQNLIRKLEEKQNQLNAINLERNERQDKELRELRTDTEITLRVVMDQQFVKEDEE